MSPRKGSAPLSAVSVRHNQAGGGASFPLGPSLTMTPHRRPPVLPAALDLYHHHQLPTMPNACLVQPSLGTCLVDRFRPTRSDWIAPWRHGTPLLSPLEYLTNAPAVRVASSMPSFEGLRVRGLAPGCRYTYLGISYHGCCPQLGHLCAAFPSATPGNLALSPLPPRHHQSTLQ